MKKLALKLIILILIISTMNFCEKATKIDYLNQIPPGLEPEKFAPGIISSNRHEYAITFTPDGNEFYFTKRGGSLSQSTIMIMKKEWDVPQVASFSGIYADSEPFITPDGKRLYFGSRRPLEDDEIPKRPHIWITDRINSEWSKPRLLGSPFHDIFIMYPTLTKDGTLYFSGRGGIHRSILTCDGYEKIERLSDSINSGPAAHPFIAPDESYLIFDGRDRPDGFGGWDLYISFHSADGSWTKAKNMGEKINSDSNELCASVSPDGKYLFYESSRDDDVMNIYWVDAKILDGFRPNVSK
jgi:Tol biopolymer transport system component